MSLIQVELGIFFSRFKQMEAKKWKQENGSTKFVQKVTNQIKETKYKISKIDIPRFGPY